MTPPTTRRHGGLTYCLAQGEANLLADGTLWSHAAIMGDFFKGSAFTLDEPFLRSMKDNFDAQVYAKVSIDYEHETVSKRAAGTTQVPWTVKGGEVLELALVLDEADLNDAMRKQVADETARRQKLSDKRPIEFRGLWIRWEPTARALSLVQKREVTELSIAFDEDYVDKSGVARGPTLLSVALTNTPFLDGMISVAASRGDGGSPAGPGQEIPTMSTTGTQGGAKLRLLALVSALIGKPVETEDEAIAGAEQKITQLSRDLDAARAELTPAKTYLQLLSAELGGETDPGKAVAKIRELTAAAQRATQASADAAKVAAESTAETIVLKHEAKLGSKPLRDHFKTELVKELTAGVAAGATKTEQLLSAMPAATNLEQRAAGDTGGSPSADRDTRIDLRARALCNEDETLKALAREKGSHAAYVEAIKVAAREIDAGAGGAAVAK